MATSSPTASDSRRIYSGDEANERVRSLAERRTGGMLEAGESVTTGIPYFDENNPPLMRGELAVLLGLTSHGKTLAAATIGNHVLRTLGNSGDRALLIVMTEETVEARRVQMWGDSAVTIRDILNGRASLEQIDRNISKTRGQPVFYLGSVTGAEDVATGDGAIRPSTVADAINQLLRRGVSPELVIVDHAHDMEPDRPYSDDQQRCDWVADGLKRLANYLGNYCPMLVLGQVKKELETRAPLDAQPNAYDIKYMQSLIARSRDVYSVYYPQRHKANGMTFSTVHGDFKASRGLFLMHCAKARNGRCAGDTVPMSAMDDDGKWSNQLFEMRS